MRRVPALLFAGFLGLNGALAPDLAHAQDSEDAVFSGLFVELLPVGDLPGDGVSPVTLYLVALDAQGQPLPGVELKSKASAGTLSEPSPFAPGLLQLTYTPPEVDATTGVTLEFKGKTANKDKFKRTWDFTVRPPVSQRVAVAVSPQELVLKDGATASVEVTFVGGSPQFREGADLILRANVGAIENLTVMGDGAYTALYRAPEADMPQVAILTAVDGRDPTRTYGHVTLPLTAPRDLKVESKPDAKVMVKVGDREFGPVPTDRRGRATVPVVLAPGVQGGTLITLKDNAREESPLDLELPPWPRLEWFGHYPSLPGDSAVDLPLRLAVVRADGSPDPSAALALTAEGASFAATRHEGGGVYQVELEPDPAVSIVETALTAGITGEDAAVELPVRLVPVRPAELTLAAKPSTLSVEDRTFTVTARIRDARGAGLPSRSVGFTAAGARLDGAPEDHGDGSYTATFNRIGKGPAELLATVKAPASTNPVRQIVALPTRDRLPPDGLSSTTLTILAVDEFGYPVAGVPLQLTLLRGDGKVPTKAQTDENGVAQVQYTAGREVGLVNLMVTAGDRSRNVGLMQLPPDLAPGLSVPFSGTAVEAALRASWAPIVQPLRLERAD